MDFARTRSLLLGVAIFLGPATIAHAESCSSSPLVLDLDGDGIHTSNRFDQPVWFDLLGSGDLVRTGWTSDGSEDAFLWIDFDKDGSVGGGKELFGEASPLPDGTTAANGFEALKVFDGEVLGGNGDGKISERDLVWYELGLWLDRNHNGNSDPEELHSLAEFGVESLSLAYSQSALIDGNGNWHFLTSTFSQRAWAPWGEAVIERSMVDVYFLYDRGIEAD